MDSDTFLRKIYPESMFNDDSKQENTPANAPFLTLTYAQSLDAMIAGKAGKQIILSGKESMAMTHRLRALHNAILVGVGTVINDDPQLNCRIPRLLPVHEQPQPYILDSHARTPINCKLIRNAQAGIGKFPVIVCTIVASAKSEEIQDRKENLQDLGCRILEVPVSGTDRRLSLDAFKRALPSNTRLMVEGGSSVISSFLYSGLVDRLVVTVAPTLIGQDGIPVTRTSGSDSMPKLQHIASQQFGIDTVFACALTK